MQSLVQKHTPNHCFFCVLRSLWELFGGSLGGLWGSLGGLLGALGGLLGDLWGLQIDPKGVTRFGFVRAGALVGLCWSLLVAEDGLQSVLGPSWAPSGCSRGSLWSSFGARRTDFEL